MPNSGQTNCVFCRVIRGDETVSVIHEDDEVLAFLDIQPLHPGHCWCVPEQHHRDLLAAPERLASRTFETARRLLPGRRTATGCRAVNLFSPNGADGGQEPLPLPSASHPRPAGPGVPAAATGSGRAGAHPLGAGRGGGAHRPLRPAGRARDDPAMTGGARKEGREPA